MASLVVMRINVEMKAEQHLVVQYFGGDVLFQQLVRGGAQA